VSCIIIFFFSNIILYSQIPPHGNFIINSYNDKFYHYAKGDKLLWRDNGSWILFYSKDCGKTVTNSYNFHVLKKAAVWREFFCSNGNIIVASDSLIFYSTDEGKSFNLAIDSHTSLPVKCQYWNNPNSIDEGNGVVMFGDYGPDGPHPGGGEMIKCLWRSYDFGVTWSNILTEVHDPTGSLPGSIRHFHTCQFNKNSNAWLVTTGDWNFQVNWLISSDDGNHWYQVDSTHNQYYRTITPLITSSNKVIWGTDNGLKSGGIYSVDWDRLYDSSRTLTQLSYSKGAEIYNLFEFNGQLMYADRVDTNASFSPGIYYSPDLGTSWQQVLTWPLTNTQPGGFIQGCGVDDSGRVFLPLTSNTQGYGSVVGITFTFLKVQLLNPINNSTVDINPLQLKWMKIGDANTYRLQFGTDSLFFSTIIDTTDLADTTFNMDGLKKLTTYYWRISSTNTSGTIFSSPIWKFSTSDEPTNLILVNPGSNTLPLDYGLLQNYPNPFNPVTNINYTLPEGSYVTLKVYDLLGREVATLVNANKPAGKYSVVFEGNKCSSGVYIYSLHSGSYNAHRKMVLLK
jgi:hypothetical protein